MVKLFKYFLLGLVGVVLISCSMAGIFPGRESSIAQTAINSTEASRYKLAGDYSKSHQGLSLLVSKGNRIIFEKYDNGHSSNQPNRLASGTKSFWGVLAAAAVDDGLLRFDERVSDTITEWKSDPRKSKITIRQVLNFTDGIDPAFKQLNGQKISNKYQYAIDLPAVYEPGTKFAYGPSHLYIFGELMRRKLTSKYGSRYKDPLQYLDERIFQPIGLKVSSWRRDGAGNPQMPAGAFLTAREWAKFGELIKNGGKWNGQQIVSASNLAQCFVGSTVNPGYGLTFWLNRPGPGVESSEVADQAYDSPRRAARLSEDGEDIRPRRRLRLARQQRESMTLQRSNAVNETKDGIYAQGPRDLVMAAGAGKQRLYIIPSQNLVIVRQGQGGQFSNAEFLARLLDGKTTSETSTSQTSQTGAQPRRLPPGL